MTHVLWLHCADCGEWFMMNRLADADACETCGSEPDELWTAKPVAIPA